MDSPEENQAPTATVAIIDADGVYRGIDTIAADALNDKHVQVPADCDLAPGKYRWSAEHQRIEPLTELQQAPPGVPSLETAVFELVRWAQGQGAKSAVLDAYAAAFKISIDAIGAAK